MRTRGERKLQRQIDDMERRVRGLEARPLIPAITIIVQPVAPIRPDPFNPWMPPYPLHPVVPFTDPGDLILDPFCAPGTFIC